MADITDPSAISFVARIRQICEREKGTRFLIEALVTEWESGASTLIPNQAADLVIDDYSDRELDKLTGANVHTLMTMFETLLATLSGVAATNNMNQGAVRGLGDIL